VELLEIALEAAGLDGAALGEIARIEIEHQPTTPEVSQAAGARHAIEVEIRGRLIQGRQGAAKGLGRQGPRTKNRQAGDASLQQLAA
jgi:hypothetical protein